MNGVSVTELVRRIEQMLRMGTIAEVDHAAARCRVRSGELLSTWVHWLVQRAGETRTWCPPTVGEQCLLLSPGGDTTAAVALVGLYSTEKAAPSGSSFAITATEGTLNVDQLTVNAGGTTWNGPIQLNGRMDSTEDVTASGISLVNHVHSGIDRGSSNTNPPS